MTTDEMCSYLLNAVLPSDEDRAIAAKLRSMEAEMESLNDTLMIRTSDYNNLREIAKRDSARLAAAEELANDVADGLHRTFLLRTLKKYRAAGEGK